MAVNPLSQFTFKYEPEDYAGDHEGASPTAMALISFLAKVASQGLVIDGPAGTFKVRLGNGEETPTVGRSALPSAW
jgi:hypothetical protein